MLDFEALKKVEACHRPPGCLAVSAVQGCFECDSCLRLLVGQVLRQAAALIEWRGGTDASFYAYELATVLLQAADENDPRKVSR